MRPGGWVYVTGVVAGIGRFEMPGANCKWPSVEVAGILSGLTPDMRTPDQTGVFGQQKQAAYTELLGPQPRMEGCEDGQDRDPYMVPICAWQ
jgi:hypothetical protein